VSSASLLEELCPDWLPFYNAESIILELLADSTLVAFGHRSERRHGNGCSALALAMLILEWSRTEDTYIHAVIPPSNSSVRLSGLHVVFS
jgi:hypothetical protein